MPLSRWGQRNRGVRDGGVRAGEGACCSEGRVPAAYLELGGGELAQGLAVIDEIAHSPDGRAVHRVQLLAEEQRELSLRTALVRELHESTLCGHRGREGTEYHVKCRFLWPNLQKDVAAICDECERCMEAKSPLCGLLGALIALPACGVLHRRRPIPRPARSA